MEDLGLDALPALPGDEDGPLFREPWEAQAFALAVRLSEQGLFTWNEWVATLASEIEHAQARGDADLGDTYYEHWLAALERLVAEKQAVAGEDITQRREDWRAAYLNTPHGQPVALSAGRR